MMSDLKDLTKEEKEELVDRVNEDLKSEPDEPREDDEGTTSIFTMNDIDEKAGEGSAQAQYDKSVTANATSLAVLHSILNTKDKSMEISRKNLVKLIFATLKLPEEGAYLKFGGTDQQKQVCEFAYAQMQLAANCRAFVLGVDAMRQHRRALKEAEKEGVNLNEKRDEVAELEAKFNMDGVSEEELIDSINKVKNEGETNE